MAGAPKLLAKAIDSHSNCAILALMFSLLIHCFRWLFSKAALIAAVWIITLSLVAGWLFLREKNVIPGVSRLPTGAEIDFTMQRLDELARQSKKLQAEALHTYDEKKRQLASMAREYEEDVETVQKLSSEVMELRDLLQRILAWLSQEDVPKEKELAAKEKQLSALKAMLPEKAARKEALAAELARAEEKMHSLLAPVQQEIDRLRIQLGQYERAKGQGKDRAVQPTAPRPAWMVAALLWLEKAKQHYFWPLVITSVSILIGPFLYHALVYYFIAPVMSLAAPLRLRLPFSEPIAVSGSAASQELRLLASETALVKPLYAVASDEHLEKRTHFLFHSAYPFTSLASGLTEMLRLRLPPGSGLEDFMNFRLSARNPGTEMAVVTLEKGAALVLRPSHIAGVIFPTNQPMKLYSHWHFFSLQAWLRFHFRHFELVGSGKVILHAARGVRAEWLGDFPRRPGSMEKATRRKRVNSESTIAFTPGLQLRCVKTETFWSYFRGRQPLYDDLWEGTGVAICQEMTTGPAAGKRTFWTALGNALWNIFGL